MRERLYRSRTDRMIFGVAGGMARWLEVDPAVVRLVWALLIIAGGVGLLLYIVAAIVIPEEPLGAMPPSGTGPPPAGGGPGGTGWATPPRRDSGSAPLIIGVVLVLLGAWFLAERYISWLDNALLWPALLIVVGALLLMGAMRRPGGPSA
ncbi:MAG TPA: PspC domain-containing protein [Candidatus Deferrimicrobiaceae bacterium]|nr:PspC domain-containing protein [Candidatus Deferrimicrobiaceae bacterium]